MISPHTTSIDQTDDYRLETMEREDPEKSVENRRWLRDEDDDDDTTELRQKNAFANRGAEKSLTARRCNGGGDATFCFVLLRGQRCVELSMCGIPKVYNLH